MNDELTVKIANELINVAQLVEARMESGEWENETYVTPEQIAEKIIALVRADERKRIREALLGDEAEAAGFCAYWDNDPPVNGASPSSIQAILKNVAIAIGLTEEPS